MGSPARSRTATPNVRLHQYPHDELPDLRDGFRPRSPDTPEPDNTGREPAEYSSKSPWNHEDLLGAIGLTISAGAAVVFFGAIPGEIHSGDASPLGEVIAAVIATALSLGIVRATRLPFEASAGLLAAASIANVILYVLTDGGESELLNLPPSFIETAILSGVPFGIAWLYVTGKHRRPIREIGFVLPGSPTAYLYALAAWFIALIGVGLWDQLVTDFESIAPPDNATPILEIAGGSLFFAWLLVGLWGPFVEEAFFRGFLLSGLRGRMGQWPALLISSGVFALFHIDPGLYVPTFLLGLAFGWVYLRTRSVWPSIFAHGLHNTLAIIAVWQDIG